MNEKKFLESFAIPFVTCWNYTIVLNNSAKVSCKICAF